MGDGLHASRSGHSLGSRVWLLVLSISRRATKVEDNISKGQDGRYQNGLANGSVSIQNHYVLRDVLDG